MEIINPNIEFPNKFEYQMFKYTKQTHQLDTILFEHSIFGSFSIVLRHNSGR